MKIKTLIQTISLTAILIIVFNSCAKEQAIPTENFNNEANIEQIRQSVEATLAETQKLQENPTADVRSRCDGRVVVVRANSHNALKDAIHQAGEGGIVYLKSGVHTETEPITISHRTIIMGERGALLKIKSSLTAFDENFQFVIKPSIYILNAPGSAIINIVIQPLNDEGTCGILIENSPESAVYHCTIKKFQMGIWIEKSDKICVVNNKLIGLDIWRTKPQFDCNGIVIEDGKNAFITDNVVENFGFGIWPCSKNGICIRNTTFNNFYGIVLCKVPQSGYKMPSGSADGATISGSYWRLSNNNSYDNLAAGYLVIDGANHNLLEKNTSSRNGTYDIELTGNTDRFGFTAPFSYENKVFAFPNQKVKDCGENNTVIGGVKVDTASDPCN